MASHLSLVTLGLVGYDLIQSEDYSFRRLATLAIAGACWLCHAGEVKKAALKAAAAIITTPPTDRGGSPPAFQLQVKVEGATVMLDAAPDGFERAAPVDPRALGALFADVAGIEGRHVIVSDAAGEHRLWLRDPEPGRPLAAVIPLDKDFITRIASLLRFHRRLFGRAAGPLPRGWPLTAYRLARLDLMLRALDLRDGGATYRQIAVELGRDDATRLSASDWKMSASRSFVVRLVRDGIAMMNGDYRKLLRIR